MTDQNNENGSDPDEDLPRSIGPYKILDTLGEGGMAVVYLAEQTSPVKRHVALKIVKLGMDTKQVVARFESERQALAVLDHPNIAKIFDGGITDSGRPYFVMEQVHGVPITNYCDDHRLNTSQRIELFSTVCSAVQHAHHKGLIHRDLKPSNLLVGVVDGKPQVKIIDFGIAKATSTTLTEDTLYTRIGQVVGTPQYMSPEQADITGLDVDTRTDIYSLGVILYELLVGVVPLDLRAVADQAVRVALRERDPPLPSTRITELGDTKDEIARARGTDPQHLRRQLKGDLDWVVMCAIAKDRTRRYETANALAMECRRYLKREPVLARPPSTGYLMRRFIQRNRVIVVAGSIALLAVIAGATAATIGFVRATQAEQSALREAETARQVSDFLVELFRVSDPSEARGNSIRAREILDRGALRIRTDLSSEPQVQATLMNTIGTVYSSLGLYEDAQPLLDDALVKLEAIHGRKSQEVAAVLYGIAELARLEGDFARSKTVHREALSIRQGVLGDQHNDIAASLHALGVSLYFGAEYAEAESMLRQALAMYDQLFGQQNGAFAAATSSLGSLMHSTDRYDEAEDHFRRSLAISRQLFGENHPSVASDMNDLALVLRETGRVDEAIAVCTDAMEVYRTIYPGDHPFAAETRAQLASMLNQSGDVEGAETNYREAIGELERTVGREHMLTARALDSYGILLFSSKRYDEARPILAESVALHKVLLGDRHINTARAMNNMAALLFLTGQYEQAEPYFRDSLSIRTEVLGEENGDVANSKNNLADLLNRLGRYAEAEPLAADAAASYGQVFSESHWRAAVARNIHGASLAGMRRFEKAENLIVESTRIIAESRPGSIYHRMALERTIHLYDAWAKRDKSKEYRQKMACVEQGTPC